MVAKRVLISIDERLLERIDREADRLGASRSAYVADLAARDLNAGPGTEAGVQAAMRRLSELFAEAPKFDPTGAIKALRRRQ